jgi:hypothetical protein
MAVFHERRRSSAALWSRRVAAFSVVLLLTAAAAHRFSLVDAVPFFWVLGAVGGLAVAALVLAANGFVQLWNHGDKGGRDSTYAVIIALLALAPFLISGFQIAALPFLSDISTDLTDPPKLLRAAQLRTPAMSPVATITPEQAAVQQRNYPEVTGRRYDVPSDRVREAIDALLAEHDWLLIDPGRANAPNEGGLPDVTIELTAYTVWLAFPVDVAIRLTDEGETSYVDMRSASRWGRHDFGDNARRITAFLEELDAEVVKRVAVTPSDQ